MRIYIFLKARVWRTSQVPAEHCFPLPMSSISKQPFCLCFDTATCVPSTAPTVLIQTRAFTVAELTVGCYIPELKIPDQHARFMNVGYYIIGTPTVGTVTAYIDITTCLLY